MDCWELDQVTAVVPPSPSGPPTWTTWAAVLGTPSAARSSGTATRWSVSHQSVSLTTTLALQDSWEKGYFRDCNGESNGQPLPGNVIK